MWSHGKSLATLRTKLFLAPIQSRRARGLDRPPISFFQSLHCSDEKSNRSRPTCEAHALLLRCSCFGALAARNKRIWADKKQRNDLLHAFAQNSVIWSLGQAWHFCTKRTHRTQDPISRIGLDCFQFCHRARPAKQKYICVEALNDSEELWRIGQPHLRTLSRIYCVFAPTWL